MGFLKEVRKTIGAMVVLAVMTSGCSLVDEPVAEASNSDPEHEEKTAVAKVDSPTLQPEEEVAAEPSEPSDAECSTSADCATLPNTARWCSSEGQCEYSCESGYGDANGEVEEDGCECQVSHPGGDVCDGTDSDCDGVVDNPFAGGELAAGESGTCAVDRGGDLACWGDKLEVTGDGAGLESIDVAWRHGCGVDQQGRAWCFGDDTYGKLGDGADEPADEPVEVDSQSRFVDVATGADHSCGVTDDGRIECWGRNDYGQLGDGTSQHRAEPTEVSATIEFEAVTAGAYHTCALSAAGDVLCWGANLQQQTSQSDTPSLNVPTLQEAPVAFASISAGDYHTCALDAGGLTYCWGSNEHGQLGDGTKEGRGRPSPIVDELGLEAISAGGSHTCGISPNGKVYCWGNAADGRLSKDDPSHDHLSPVPAAGTLRAERLAAGGSHTCALDGDGKLYCWGQGSRGQLGAESTSSSRRPARADCPRR